MPCLVHTCSFIRLNYPSHSSSTKHCHTLPAGPVQRAGGFCPTQWSLQWPAGQGSGTGSKRLQHALRGAWLAVLAAAMERPAEAEQAVLAMPPGDLHAHLLRPMADGEPRADKRTCIAPAMACSQCDGVPCNTSLGRHCHAPGVPDGQQARLVCSVSAGANERASPEFQVSTNSSPLCTYWSSDREV